MWPFSDSKPHVNKMEYKQARGALYSHGFTSLELSEIDMLFTGDFEKSGTPQYGIDAKELAEKISWLRANRSKHHLESDKISKLEAIMKKFI